MNFLIEHAPQNPTLEYANSIIVPDGTTLIISKGGGSTIDVGKWVAHRYKLPHKAIPTTAGTGSEVTKYIVLTVNGKKVTYENDECIPQSYVLDSDNVVTLPELYTLSSGLDALSQTIEASWSRKATPWVRALSNVSFNLIKRALPLSLKEPNNKSARMDMLVAANLSGRCINITRTNVCHAISYPLTDLYGIPHGIACAMSLGYFSTLIGRVDVAKFLKTLDIPAYDFDAEVVAYIASKSEKLKDYKLNITYEDIIKALS